MKAADLLKEASLLHEELIQKRRYLHAHPEVGFDLTETYKFVYDQLVSFGYAPHAYGKCGLIASCGHKEKGKTEGIRGKGC